MSNSTIAVPAIPWHSDEARMRNFNETTGVFGYIGRVGDWVGPIGANHHPDRCVCQGNPNPEDSDKIGSRNGGSDYGEAVRIGRCGPNGDTTPHKHRDDGSCARCVECDQYRPMVPK